MQSVLKVLGPRVLVRPTVPVHVTETGILLPETRANDLVFTGTVLAVGRGLCEHCGQALTETVQVGDTVGYEPTGGQQIEVGGDTLMMLWIENLIFVAEA